MKKTNEPTDPNTPKSRLHRLGLYGLVSYGAAIGHRHRCCHLGRLLCAHHLGG
jgi:hypothetical protein